MSRDPRWQSSEVALVERIRDEILASPTKRITFARFMERALTEPELGYYASNEERPTREGDFLTAPELHPLFGRCLARFVSAAWHQAGKPDAYLVHEYGAGRGTLRASVMRGLETDGSSLASTLEWLALDLPGRGDATMHAGSPDLVVANEYLDALPVHRVIAHDGLKEIYIGWQDGWFSEIIDEPSEAGLARQLHDSGVELVAGQRAEICLRAPQWLRDVASTAGLVLVIDYGHPAVELYGPRRMAGSLLTYRDHVVADDPLSAVGHTDITTHVDVTALQRTAVESGMVLLGATSQARFLAELGLGELLSDLGRDPATTPPEYVAARASVARLLDPRHLGGFQVLAWGRTTVAGASAPLRGFGPTA